MINLIETEYHNRYCTPGATRNANMSLTTQASRSNTPVNLVMSRLNAFSRSLCDDDHEHHLLWRLFTALTFYHLDKFCWTDTSTQSTDGYFLKRAREETWHTFWCSLYIHKPQQERWNPFIAPRRNGTNTSLNERGKTGGQTSMHAIYIQAAMTAQCSDPII